MGWSSTCGLCFCFYRLRHRKFRCLPGAQDHTNFWVSAKLPKIVQCATGGKGRQSPWTHCLDWSWVQICWMFIPNYDRTKHPINFHLFCGKDYFKAATLGYEVERPQSHRLISSPFDDVAVEHCCWTCVGFWGGPCLFLWITEFSWVMTVMIRSLTRRTSNCWTPKPSGKLT